MPEYFPQDNSSYPAQVRKLTVNDDVNDVNANDAAQALAKRTDFLKALVETLQGDTYTKAEVDQLVNNLIDDAPDALNTLNELAAALNDNDSEIAALLAAIDQRLTQVQADALYLPKTYQPFLGNLFHIQYVEPNGVNGTSVGTGTANIYQLKLNNVVSNTIAGASLDASYNFTLPAGTYHFYGRFIASHSNVFRAYLDNNTDGGNLLYGTNENGTDSGTGDTAQTTSVIDDEFTITGTKSLRVLMYVSNVTNLFGFSSSSEPANSPAIYHYVKIRRIGD